MKRMQSKRISRQGYSSGKRSGGRSHEENKDLLSNKPSEKDILQKGEAESFKDSDSKVIYAFVVFRSMEGVRLLNSAYYHTYWQRFFADFCCCKDEAMIEEIEKLKFMGKYPKIETAILPDGIQWKNLEYGSCNVCFRQFLQILMGILFLLLSIYLSIEIQSHQQYLQNRFIQPADDCPTNITKYKAI